MGRGVRRWRSRLPKARRRGERELKKGGHFAALPALFTQELRECFRRVLTQEKVTPLQPLAEGGTAEELWSRYMQLTEAEASFRTLKSELSIRPLFHQLEPRVKAHVMVAFLGYALWFTLKHLLKRRAAIAPQSSVSGVTDAQPLSAMKALALLSTLQSADIVLPTTDGRQIRLPPYYRTHGRAESAPAAVRSYPP